MEYRCWEFPSLPIKITVQKTFTERIGLQLQFQERTKERLLASITANTHLIHLGTIKCLYFIKDDTKHLLS